MGDSLSPICCTTHDPWVVQHCTIHGAWVFYSVVQRCMAHGSWKFVTMYGPWVMGKKSLKGLQKKFARLAGEWKRDADRELRGEKEMLERAETEILGAVVKAWNEVLAEGGGVESWESLSKERQDDLVSSIVRRVRMMFREEAYKKLTPAKKRRADLFIWTGCAMHKDLNATKGGAEAMAQSWKDGEMPVKLMNKNHVAAAATGSIELAKRGIR
jgi:hypothetical protein